MTQQERNQRIRDASIEMLEALEEIHEMVTYVASLLQDRLSNGEPVHESEWLDPLMVADGAVMGAIDKAKGK